MNVYNIPKKIYQTWIRVNVTEKLKKFTDTWREMNPEYEYILYDDKMIKEFLTENFDKNVMETYNKINKGAFKADLWRYCILYKYGGYYADIDSLCLGKIDNFVENNTDFIVPIDLNNSNNKHCLFNSFIGTIPNNPILLECINQIVFNVKNNIIPTFNLDIAGPGLLGKKTNLYLGLKDTSSFCNKEGILKMFCNDDTAIIKTICFLKFEPYVEYVRNLDGRILFQNKNGNNEIKEAYLKECELCNVNHDWAIGSPY
jgi:hypothetical protein